MTVLEEIINNKIIQTAVLSWFVAQLIKIVIDCIKN